MSPGTASKKLSSLRRRHTLRAVSDRGRVAPAKPPSGPWPVPRLSSRSRVSSETPGGKDAISWPERLRCVSAVHPHTAGGTSLKKHSAMDRRCSVVGSSKAARPGSSSERAAVAAARRLGGSAGCSGSLSRMRRVRAGGSGGSWSWELFPVRSREARLVSWERP